MISWLWSADGTAKMATTTQTPEDIKLTQGYKLGEKVAIHRESCDIAQRTLGTWINPSGMMTHPDGTVKTEHTVYLSQAQAWANSIIHSNMSRKEVHMAYHGILQTKIGYALAVTTFTKKQLRKIQRAADVVYKPKIGLNRNFPSAVLQGQTDFCGLAHPPFYTQQGFK